MSLVEHLKVRNVPVICEIDGTEVEVEEKFFSDIGQWVWILTPLQKIWVLIAVHGSTNSPTATKSVKIWSQLFGSI